jgi:hypothetical protein
MDVETGKKLADNQRVATKLRQPRKDLKTMFSRVTLEG